MHEVLSKGIASPTPLPPAPHGARSTLRDKGPGSHSSIPPPSLCSWPPGDPPSPCTPRTLPWSQRGLSGSESLLLVLLPPLSERGLPREGDPTSEGGGVSISITSAFTTSMGVSALAPPLLQEATRSLRDSAGSEAGLRRAGGGDTEGSWTAPARPMALTALLHGHPQAEVLLLQLLVALLQVADVLDGFPQDRRLVELPETMGGGSAPLPAAPSSPPAPAPFAPPSPVTAHPPWPRCPPPGP